MKKKNLLWVMIAMIMVGMLSVGFVACNDDGSNANDDDSGNISVTGIWSGKIDNDDELSLNFKKDGTGTWTRRSYDYYSGPGMKTDRGSFKYKMEGESKGIITIEEYGSMGYSNEIIYFEIEREEMLLSDEDHDDMGSLTKEYNGDISGTSVVGTWSGKIDGEDQLTLNFKEDGTGTWTGRYYGSYSGIEADKGPFKYEMEGKSKGVIAISHYEVYHGYTNYFCFEIEGKTMRLYEDYYGDDYWGSLTKE